MKKVITYGTYDLLHYGHIKLLERAKELGDYLIVGITADDFDKNRGKINVQQSLMERIENVRSTGLADEIIVEEYEGQKIDDIKRLGVDVFTVGSDWEGHFDYLNKYCKVVYLERTAGISSSEIRAERREVRLGLIGDVELLNKFEVECSYVNGIKVIGICTKDFLKYNERIKNLPIVTSDLDYLLSSVDAVYIVTNPVNSYETIKKALTFRKHVLCESPITVSLKQWEELQNLAKQNCCVLMDAIKTAYSTAYYRLLLLVKSGIIGEVVSVDSVCTSLKNLEQEIEGKETMTWNSICSWGPTAMLPIFQILGKNYQSYQITSRIVNERNMFDAFTKISFVYPHAVASLKVGKGIKSEGELIISGTKGYIYVPAPWWKTDYFEVRYENSENNKRYFYQLDGEGIRYELVSFLKAIESRNNVYNISLSDSENIIRIIESYYKKSNFIQI